MNCLMLSMVLSKSMVHVQSVRIMLEHHCASFGKNFHNRCCSLCCTSEDGEPVHVLSCGYTSSLFGNLILPPMRFKTDCRPVPWDGYAVYTRGCAPFSLFRIN